MERTSKLHAVKELFATIAEKSGQECAAYWSAGSVYKSFIPSQPTLVPRDIATEHFYTPFGISSSSSAAPVLRVSYPNAVPGTSTLVDVPAVGSAAKVGPNDALANAGGPIWALDWCPMEYDARHDTQFIALATKSPDTQELTMGTQASGRGAVQIWSVRGLYGCSTSEESTPTLALELAILHDYGTVLELQWCPTGAYSSGSSEDGVAAAGRLGLIAAATSSGNVVVWSVPLPCALGDDVPRPVFVRLEPAFCAFVPGAVPTSLQWSLDQQHSSLLVGFSDGRVRVWAPEEGRDSDNGDDAMTPVQSSAAAATTTVKSAPTPFFECICGALGVRSVRWSPLLSDVFAAAVLTHLPELQIWSLQNPFSPLQSIIPSGCKYSHTHSLSQALFIIIIICLCVVCALCFSSSSEGH